MFLSNGSNGLPKPRDCARMQIAHSIEMAGGLPRTTLQLVEVGAAAYGRSPPPRKKTASSLLRIGGIFQVDRGPCLNLIKGTISGGAGRCDKETVRRLAEFGKSYSINLSKIKFDSGFWLKIRDEKVCLRKHWRSGAACRCLL